MASHKHNLKLSVLIGFQCFRLFCLVKRARLCGSYPTVEAQGLSQVKRGGEGSPKGEPREGLEIWKS